MQSVRGRALSSRKDRRTNREREKERERERERKRKETQRKRQKEKIITERDIQGREIARAVTKDGYIKRG